MNTRDEFKKFMDEMKCKKSYECTRKENGGGREKRGILVIDNAKQSEFKRIRKILEKAKYKGSFSVP